MYSLGNLVHRIHMLMMLQDIVHVTLHSHCLSCVTPRASLLQAFGVPTILAYVGEKPSLYFGSDRFPLLAQELNEPWLGPEPGALNAKL